MRTRPLVLVLAGLAVVVVVVLLLMLRGDDGSEVTASSTDRLPTAASLNRSDDAGEDTVRAYLRGALACAPGGAALMDELAAAQGASVTRTLRGSCSRAGRPWASEVHATLVGDSLDRRGRALWRVSASGAEARVAFWVAQQDGSWTVTEACPGLCVRAETGL